MVYLMPRILCMWQIEIINFISCKNLLGCSWLRVLHRQVPVPHCGRGNPLEMYPVLPKKMGSAYSFAEFFFLLLEKFGKENLN